MGIIVTDVRSQRYNCVMPQNKKARVTGLFLLWSFIFGR